MSASTNGVKLAISPEQVRAARALLDCSQGQLATASGVPMRTLVRFEGDEGAPRAATVAALRAALEAAGVEFTNGDTPGVRLLLRLSIPVEDGDHYVFQCVHRSGRFSVHASKVALDALDSEHNPEQPLVGRLTRFSWLLLPRLYRLLERRAGRPIEGTLVVTQDDLR
jgi:transcriptional regulator with XRE-family HTH domain